MMLCYRNKSYHMRMVLFSAQLIFCLHVYEYIQGVRAKFDILLKKQKQKQKTISHEKIKGF